LFSKGFSTVKRIGYFGEPTYSVQRSGGTSFLETINISTGAVTQVGDMGVIGISALAFQPNVAAVPEPSTLISGGIACMLGVGYGWRRRKARLAA
jgi:hypothetical protein